MAAVTGWVRRNKRRLLFGSAVAGGLVLVGKVVQRRLLQAQEEETRVLLERARRQHHFETTSATCSQTILQVFPSLRQAVEDKLASEPITSSLRSKPPPQNKLELWDKLKVIAFARCSALVLGGVYISLMVRIQLNVLAGYLYQQQVFCSSGFTATIGEGKTKISSNIQEKYLEICTRFVSKGMDTLCCHLTDIVQSVTEEISLKQKMSLPDIEKVLTNIFSQVETSENERNIFRNPGVYFLPVEDIIESEQDILTALTIQEKNLLKQMFEETLDVLDSEDTISLAISCSRQGVSHLVDRVAEYYATIGMTMDYNQNQSTDPISSGKSALHDPSLSCKSALHDSGFVSPANVSLAVAKLIPILSGLVHNPQEEQDLWLLHLLEDPNMKLLGANVYETFCQVESKEDAKEDSWMDAVTRTVSSFF